MNATTEGRGSVPPRSDVATVDRLLRGHLPVEGTPPRLERVAALVRALTRPVTPAELERETTAVAVASAILRSRSPVREPVEVRRPRRSDRAGRGRSFVRIKVVALAAATAVVGTGGLALAGWLPGPAQEAAAHVLSKVGIDVPDPSEPDPDPAEPGATGARQEAPVGSGADGPSGKGADVSSTATSTDAEGVDKGGEISEQASGGTSQAGDHGQAGNEHGQRGPRSDAEGRDDDRGPPTDAGNGRGGGERRGRGPGSDRGHGRP